MKEIGKVYELLKPTKSKDFEDILREHTDGLVEELRKNGYTPIMTDRDTNSYVLYKGEKVVGHIHFNAADTMNDEDLKRFLSKY